MFKMLGSLIILFSCSMMGMEKGKETSRHRKELEELYRLFMLYHMEMKYLKQPVGEILMKLEHKVERSYQIWLQNLAISMRNVQQGAFSDIWEISIEETFKESLLKKNEREELKRIGKCLGHEENIEMFLKQLEIFIQDAREEEKEKKKLYQSMGILVGIFLSLVLI